MEFLIPKFSHLGSKPVNARTFFVSAYFSNNIDICKNKGGGKTS